jgi:hypothetical protein
MFKNNTEIYKRLIIKYGLLVNDDIPSLQNDRLFMAKIV